MMTNQPEFETIEEFIAIICHQANKGYCEAIGDHSQQNWVDAPQWQKDSAIAGVKAILENPSMTPEQSHEGWMEVKRQDGWVYGEVKDAEKKTHPCFRPYDELPTDQKAKDHIFRAIVLALPFKSDNTTGH